MAAAVRRVVAGDHHRLDAHAPQLAEALLDATLHDVLELDHHQASARAVGHDQWRATTARGFVGRLAFVTLAAATAPPSDTRPWAARWQCRCALPDLSVRAEVHATACASAAVNGTNVASTHRERAARAAGAAPWPAATMLRPSGVSSASDASCAASASCASLTPSHPRRARRRDAWRLPSVMVPVLSSISTSTSPAASTARPGGGDARSCLQHAAPCRRYRWRRAGRRWWSGMRQTSSATSTT